MIRTTFLLIALCAIVAEHSAAVTNRSERSAETCGVTKINTGLIRQGKRFARGTFPWIVALLNTEENPPEYFCGGTLISKIFVISVAHCISLRQSNRIILHLSVRAVFGAHELDSTTEQYRGRYQRTPKKIIIHPSYDPWVMSYDADISLLEFEKGEIYFNNYVQPVCLWHSKVESSVTGTVAGWGQSEDTSRDFENEPKMVKPLIKSNEECFLETKSLVDLSSTRTFCAGLRDGSGVCFGDSGNALFTVVDGAFYLKGIVSASMVIGMECDVSRNAVYGNVMKFKDWINSYTKIAKELICGLKTLDSWYSGSLQTCKITETIDTENHFLGGLIKYDVKRFDISYNKNAFFLPIRVGEKLPYLKMYRAEECELTIVQDFHFINMRNLEYLDLNRNKISTIEPDSFKGLINVQLLFLEGNLIQILDENVFSAMVSLGQVYLRNNQLHILEPGTFIIPNGKLRDVNLEGNACINKNYNQTGSNNLYTLDNDLTYQCSSLIFMIRLLESLRRVNEALKSLTE